MKVFICDDDMAMCTLVRIWLEDAGMTLVGAAPTPEAALAGLSEATPDVVLIDTVARSRPGLSVSDVRRLAPQARVVVYSGLPAEIAAERVEGAADLYLTKDVGPEHLLEAIDRVTAAGRPPAT